MPGSARKRVSFSEEMVADPAGETRGVPAPVLSEKRDSILAGGVELREVDEDTGESCPPQW